MKRRGHKVFFDTKSEVSADLERLDRLVHDADVVHLGRTGDPKLFAALLLGRKLYDYKLVVDTDDLVCEVPKYNPSSVHWHSATGLARLALMQYREADLVTVSTPELLEDCMQHNGNVVEIPNCSNSDIYPEATRWRTKEAWHADDQRIYWGGGSGHYDDLLVLKGVLTRIFHERPNVKLIFSNFVPDWAADLDPHRIFMIPFADFRTYAKVVAWLCADVAVAPLVDNSFNRAKSHVKYLDYTAARIPGVYSDLPPYRSVRDGVTGLKATTDDEWHRTITYLLDNPQRGRDIVKAARTHINMEFTVDRWASRYESMLTELIERQTAPLPQKITEGVTIECPTPL